MGGVMAQMRIGASRICYRYPPGAPAPDACFSFPRLPDCGFPPPPPLLLSSGDEYQFTMPR